MRVRPKRPSGIPGLRQVAMLVETRSWVRGLPCTSVVVRGSLCSDPERWSIRPNGEKDWIVAKGVRKPNSVLGVLCRQNFPGFVTLPGREQETYYRCEEGYEEDAKKVIETECRRLLQNFRHEARVQAVRDYYATRRIRLDKAKCRDAKMEKEHYMKVPPRWCVDKMDCWEALVDQWCSETWEASHNNAKERHGKMVGVPHHQGSVNLIQFGENWARHNKTEAPQMYDLYAMAHTASYKKTAIQKEREAMQAAMEEKDKEIMELEERTTALVEAERARNDASTRAIYELFVPKEGDERRRKRKNERKGEEEEEKKKKEREEDKKKEDKEEKKKKELLLLLLPPSSSFSFSFFFSSSSASFSSSSSSSSFFYFLFFLLFYAILD
ncbi:hypothetical protein ZWY2020_035686 [Hordeum vulgare]|nr:hypothetical protein ZWY2020_035686 [Hordeum vulgare]